jgi:hypothetical protein
MALITGPGYGLDEATVPRFVVGMYGVFLMIGAALMSILTISRHTRTEEQTGRAELVRANVTGRHTQLIAALALTVFMNLLLSACMAAVFGFSQAAPDSLSSTLLFTVGIGRWGASSPPSPRHGTAEPVRQGRLGDGRGRAGTELRPPRDRGHVARVGGRARATVVVLAPGMVAADGVVHPRSLVAAAVLGRAVRGPRGVLADRLAVTPRPGSRDRRRTSGPVRRRDR